MVNKTEKTIGQYDIIETVREFPEWCLYRAFDNETKNIVLIKTHYPGLPWSEKVINEFFDRLSTLRFVEHDRLLPILDFGKFNKTPYIVYPDLQAVALPDYLSLPNVRSRQFLVLFQKIAEGMEFLHQQDIVHGSLSPENTLVDTQGNPRIMDHGLSEIFKKLVDENAQGDLINLSFSNVGYTSPEQILGRSATGLSDIYAFGMIFHACGRGDYLAGGKTAPEIAIAHLRPGEEWSRKSNNNLGGGVLRFLLRCTRVEPESRYQGFPEIVKILRRMAGSRKELVHPLRGLAALKTRRSRIPIHAYVGAALVLIVGLFFLVRSLNKTAGPAAQATPTLSVAVISPTSIQAQPTALAVLPPTATAASTSSVQPYIPANKPSLEGQPVTLVDHAITLNNLKSLMEYSRLGYGIPEDADISADGNSYAIAASGGIFIYTTVGNTLSSWIDPQGWATSVQFSPDDSKIAVGLRSGEIQIWSGNARVATLSGHTDQVSRLIISKNGRYLYSASYDQTIAVWDLETKTLIRSIKAHAGPVRDISVTSDARMVASCSNDGLIRIWDLSTGLKLYELPYEGDCNAVAISSDGEYLAVGGENGYVRQWTVKQRQPRTDLIPIKDRVWSLEYIQDDQKIFVGMENGAWWLLTASQEKYPGTPYNLGIPARNTELIKRMGTHFEFKETIITNDTGTRVVSTMWDGTVRNQNETVWSASYDLLDQLVLSQNGTTVATSGTRGFTGAWRVKNNTVVFRATSDTRLPGGEPIAPDDSGMIIQVPGMYQRVSLPQGSTWYLSDTLSGGMVSFARGGTVVISATLNQSKTWDYGSGYEVFSSAYGDSACLVTGSQNNAEILQVMSVAGPFPSWSDAVKNLCLKSAAYRDTLQAYSHSLNLFLYTKSNGYLDGFDPQANQVLWTYQPEETITAVAASPDGQIVAVGSQNGKMVFLNGSSGQPVFTTIGNFGEVTEIRFSNDGRWIATAGSDGVVRLFSVPGN